MSDGLGTDVLLGDVLITRYPCKLPTDVQKVCKNIYRHLYITQCRNSGRQLTNWSCTTLLMWSSCRQKDHVEPPIISLEVRYSF